MQAVEQETLISLDESTFSNIGSSLEAIVELAPERIAIQTATESISYCEFDERVNRVAHTVLEMTDGASARVGLLFDQSAEAIIAIFGVLKAGATFVPLDASYPEAKLIEICESCTPSLLLTDQHQADLANTLAEAIKLPVVDVADVLRSNSPVSPPSLSVDADSMAYIFYTSGSTGNPKGVCQTQRNLFHFIRVYSDTLSVCAEDRLSLLYSLGFSASNMDVFSAILNGATLCPYNIRKTGTAGLVGWMDAIGITVLHAVPTVFRHLCASVPAGQKLQTVRAIDLGGEAVYSSDLARLKSTFSDGCLCVNHLAATEASVIAQYPMNPDLDYEREVLPVGYAADGIELTIVDPDGRLLPTGETGEIQISSPYITPGYWNLAELNAQVFASDPERAGWRIYRSGDLGFYTEDGLLHFLGRKDHRVKIRGFSVDISEVEAAIRQSESALNEVVVVARSLEEQAPLQLTAFFTTDSPESIDVAALREALGRRIASYMLPADFIVVEKLPENASGKVDRKALALSKLREVHQADEGGSLKSETEKRIAAIFRQVLKIEEVSRDDDFFHLGGDSLRATELHALVEAEFGFQVSLALLFSNPVLKALADMIDKHSKDLGAGANSQMLIPLRRSGSNPILFLTHGLNGQAFVSPHFLSILGADQPVYAFQASGLTRIRDTHLSIAEMAQQYIRAMQEVQPVGPYLLVSICSGCILSLEIAQQLEQMGEKVSPLLMIDPPVDPPGERSWFKRWKRRRADRKKRVSLEIEFRKRFTQKLIKHEKQGRIALDISDQEALDAAIAAALDFSFALNDYLIRPYAGDVILLGSRDRLATGTGKLRRKLIGSVEFYDVGERHTDIHEVTNQLFAKMLRRSLDTMISTMRGM